MVWTIIPARMLARFNGFFVHLVMSQRRTGCFPLVLRLCELQDQQTGRVCSFGLPVIYIVELHKIEKDGVLITVQDSIVHNVSIQHCVLFSQDLNLLNKSISQAASEAAKNAHKVQAFGVFQVVGSIG